MLNFLSYNFKKLHNLLKVNCHENLNLYKYISEIILTCKQFKAISYLLDETDETANIPLLQVMPPKWGYK